MRYPEGVSFQEIPPCLCFLFCEEDSCALGDVFLLLHSHTSQCDSSRNHSSKADCNIHSSNHYYSKCSVHPKVNGSNSIASFPNDLIQHSYSIISYLHNRSLHLLVLWILFENVMSLHRTKAAIIGLLEANRVNEWVVTEKLGNALKQKNNLRTSRNSRFRFRFTERYVYVCF